jgi:hypothetical protein
MRATVRLKEIKRPISEETIGFRLQAAVPNSEGFKGMTSYKKPFLIVESSDYDMQFIEGNFLKVLEDFEKKLNWQGYTDLQFSQK